MFTSWQQPASFPLCQHRGQASIGSSKEQGWANIFKLCKGAIFLKFSHLPIHLLTVTMPVLLASSLEMATGLILPILKEYKVGMKCKTGWERSQFSGFSFLAGGGSFLFISSFLDSFFSM